MGENRDQIIAITKDITGCEDTNKIDLLVDRIIREVEEKLETYNPDSFTHGRLIRR